VGASLDRISAIGLSLGIEEGGSDGLDVGELVIDTDGSGECKSTGAGVGWSKAPLLGLMDEDGSAVGVAVGLNVGESVVESGKLVAVVEAEGCSDVAIVGDVEEESLGKACWDGSGVGRAVKASTEGGTVMGSIDGESLGNPDGAAVVADVVIVVGESLGNAVGSWVVGPCVGGEVGTAVGGVEGGKEGDDVGIVEGASGVVLGSAVG